MRLLLLKQKSRSTVIFLPSAKKPHQHAHSSTAFPFSVFRSALPPTAFSSQLFPGFCIFPFHTFSPGFVYSLFHTFSPGFVYFVFSHSVAESGFRTFSPGFVYSLFHTFSPGFVYFVFSHSVAESGFRTFSRVLHIPFPYISFFRNSAYFISYIFPPVLYITVSSAVGSVFLRLRLRHCLLPVFHILFSRSFSCHVFRIPF